MTIETATLEDLPGILTLEPAFPPKEQWSDVAWSEELTGADRTVLVAREEGRVVGVVVLRTVGDVADLYRIVVAPEHRRRGIADRLLTEGLAAVGTRVLLEVRDDNTPAIELYRRHGFDVIDRRTDYYGAGAHALIMERNPA